MKSSFSSYGVKYTNKIKLVSKIIASQFLIIVYISKKLLQA